MLVVCKEVIYHVAIGDRYVAEKLTSVPKGSYLEWCVAGIVFTDYELRRYFTIVNEDRKRKIDLI